MGDRKQNIHKDILAKSYVDANGNNVAGVSVFVHCLIVGIVCREFVKYLPKRFVKKFNIAEITELEAKIISSFNDYLYESISLEMTESIKTDKG